MVLIQEQTVDKPLQRSMMYLRWENAFYVLDIPEGLLITLGYKEYAHTFCGIFRCRSNFPLGTFFEYTLYRPDNLKTTRAYKWKKSKSSWSFQRVLGSRVVYVLNELHVLTYRIEVRVRSSFQFIVSSPITINI